MIYNSFFVIQPNYVKTLERGIDGYYRYITEREWKINENKTIRLKMDIHGKGYITISVPEKKDSEWKPKMFNETIGRYPNLIAHCSKDLPPPFNDHVLRIEKYDLDLWDGQFYDVVNTLLNKK